MIKIGSHVKFKVNKNHDDIGIVEELITTSLGAGAIVKVNNVSYKILLDELEEVEEVEEVEEIKVNKKDFREILTDEAADRIYVIQKAIDKANETFNVDTTILTELFINVLADFSANVEEKLFND